MPNEPIRPDKFWYDVEELLAEEHQLLQFSEAFVQGLDDHKATVLRALLLRNSANEPRALVVLLASRVQQLRVSTLVSQDGQNAQILSAAQVYQPLAQAVGLGPAFVDLEGISFRRLFPQSFTRLERWFDTEWPDAPCIVSQLVSQLKMHLTSTASLKGLLNDVSVTGRLKSLSSTFRKLLHSNRKDVSHIYDIKSLRVVFAPSAGACNQLAPVDATAPVQLGTSRSSSLSHYLPQVPHLVFLTLMVNRIESLGWRLDLIHANEYGLCVPHL